MEVFSNLVLILLSLVGYSAGVTKKAGRHKVIEPQLVDIFMVLLIWAGAIYSKIIFDVDRWVMILIWVIISFVIGFISIWPRILSKDKNSISKDSKKTLKDLSKKKNLWQSWRDFSLRMGSFQSRIILSFVFFIVVTPFALAIKIFSNPLNIKHLKSDSYWLQKREIEMDLEQFKRQF